MVAKNLAPEQLLELLDDQITGLEAAKQMADEAEGAADQDAADSAKTEVLATAFDAALTKQFLDRYDDAEANWKEAKKDDSLSDEDI